MRVLMLHQDRRTTLAGAGHMCRRTADALACRGHEVAVAGSVPAQPAAPGRERDRAARWLAPDLPRSLAATVDRAGWVPEVVHVTDLVDPAAAAVGLELARQAGAVLALTPATDAALWTDSGVARTVARQADVVFVLTPTEGRVMQELGVAASRLAPLRQAPQLTGAPDPVGFRRRVAARGPIVLFLGRKLPTKGYQHLVAATPAILERHPDASVVLAGPDPAGDARRLVTSVGSRALCDLGTLDEVDKHSALVAAALLCLPSVADSFPLVVVEAWHCATPVVIGPFPGAREVVRDGVDGVVASADADGVARAVVGLLDDPARRQHMARAGLLRAARELSWEAVALDVEKGYRAAITRLRPQRRTRLMHVVGRS